jgi:Na+/phosphate symporter
MVAMGTSLAEKAWDRESAVYRISGVLTVVGGWFITAFSAFTVSFIMLYIFNYGGLIAIFAMLGVAIYLLYRTNIHHKKSVVKSKEEAIEVHSITDKNISEKSTSIVINNLKSVLADFDRVIKGLEKESLKDLKKAESNVTTLTQKTKYLKNNLGVIVEKIGDESLDAGYYYVQVLDYMREMLHSIEFIIKPSLEHVTNNHKPLGIEQIDELKKLHDLLKKVISMIIISVESNDFSSQAEILSIQKDYLKLIDQSTKKQIQRVKSGQVGTRNTMLFLNIIREGKNLALQVINIFKSQRDFIEFKKGIKKV